MILTLPTPVLEKSVTEVKRHYELQWEQTNPLALEPWLFCSLAAISDLARLDAGWDGHGSPKITPEAVLRARQLLSSFRKVGLPEPAIMPMSGGGLGIQWQAGTRELQFNIYPDGEILYLYGMTDDPDSIQDGSIEPDEHDTLKRLTSWLVN